MRKQVRRAPRARAITTLQRLLTQSRAHATSLTLAMADARTVRFAFDRVHQDLFQQTATLYVKVLHRGRVGVAVAQTADPALWRETIDRAYALARGTPPQRVPSVLPMPQTIPRVTTFSPETAALTPGDYLTPLQQLMQLSTGCGARLAGSFTAGAQSLTVVNSAGVACSQPTTRASLKVVALGPTCSGYASQTVRNIDALDWEGTLARALKKCLTRQSPQDVPVGAYRVLLEPEAVAELLSWLGYIGFGAKQFAERTSFMCGRIGDQITGSAITIVDDGTDEAQLAMPFDMEGVPKQRVALIDHGVAQGLVYDTQYAQLYQTQSTGHASAPDATEGPLPAHLVMDPGEATYDRLVQALDHGLIVTRFHYVNGLLEPHHALITGLTRDGTFLVKDGEVVGPVHNVRFTDRILEAFARTRLMSRDRQLIADATMDCGGILCPALLIDDLAITGTSQTA